MSQKSLTREARREGAEKGEEGQEGRKPCSRPLFFIHFQVSKC